MKISIEKSPVHIPEPLSEDFRSSARDPVSVSSAQQDSEWDAFLQRSATGQFQQSSPWARYKKSTGWSVLRAVFERQGEVCGGFQLLWKATRLGRIGYISKGPVLDDVLASRAKPVVQFLQQLAREQGLRALIVQPPDSGPAELIKALSVCDFQTASGLGVIDATILIDLSRGQDELFKKYRASIRRQYRVARREGVEIRNGDDADIPIFYELMAASCRRQGETPNPPDESSLRVLWEALRGQKMAFLKFAQYQGQPVSGVLLLSFGRRISIFKVGWNGLQSRKFPNTLVLCESLNWAARAGFEVADFVGIERGLAETLLRDEKVSPEQAASRDFYKLRYGGSPRILPAAGLWFPNPRLRLVWRLASAVPFIRRSLERFF